MKLLIEGKFSQIITKVFFNFDSLHYKIGKQDNFRLSDQISSCYCNNFMKARKVMEKFDGKYESHAGN